MVILLDSSRKTDFNFFFYFPFLYNILEAKILFPISLYVIENLWQCPLVEIATQVLNEMT